jgi:hypothetical protein
MVITWAGREPEYIVTPYGEWFLTMLAEPSFLCMLVVQASPAQSSSHKHELRNLTGIRPYKI